MYPNDFRGAAKRLADPDLPRAGQLIGVGEDEIRAIMEVESRGAGFDRAGRPVILFEPHVFWRELGSGRKRDAAARAGLAYPRWGAKPYPKDSYPRLVDAIEIDERAALRSTSWGLGQVMGFNHKAAGFETVQAMVAAFCESEAAQLEGMIRFIDASGLGDEVRRHDWRGFARGYNGAGFARNRYDQRLAVAFKKWANLPDTPFALDHAREEDERNAASVEAQPMPGFAERATVKAVQERLIELGYAMIGKADGMAGPRTAGAIAAFQTENGYPVTGKIDAALIEQLQDAEPHAPSEARAAGKPENSRIIAGAESVRTAGGAVGLTGAIAAAGPILEQAEAVKGLIERAKEIVAPVRDLIAEHWPLFAVAIGGAIVWRMSGVIRARIADYRSGKTA